MDDEPTQQPPPQQIPVTIAYPPQFFQPQQGEEMYGARIPPRIRAAMAFLEFCAVKTMDRVTGENRITGDPHEVPGQKLAQQETVARDVACKLLMRYFKGTLNPDFWETGQAIRCGLIRPGCSHGEEPSEPEMQGSVQECRCIADGLADPDCTVCKGCGKLVCFPLKEEGDDEEGEESV